MGEDEGAAEEVWAGGEAGDVPTGAVEDGEIQGAPAVKPNKKTGDYYYTFLPLLIFDNLTTCSFENSFLIGGFFYLALGFITDKLLRKSLKSGP